MARKKGKKVREMDHDPKYMNRRLTKFINYTMKSGKKIIAEKIVYGALQIIYEKVGLDPLPFFEKALYRVRPRVELRTKRVGGSIYQIPMGISNKRAVIIAMRFILSASREKKGKNMLPSLASEILGASSSIKATGSSIGIGGAIQKREEMHKTASTYKAFSNFRKS